LKAMGVSMETFAAISGQLANSTLKSGEAGTNMRNIMLRLADPTKKARAALKELRVEISKNGKFRDMIDILGDLEKGVKGATQERAAKLLSRIFGARAITGVNILLEKGKKSLEDYRKSLTGVGITSKSMAAIMRQSIGNRLKALASAATEAGFKFLDAFKVNGVNGIESLTNAIRDFNMKPIIDGTKFTVDLFRDLFTAARAIIVILSPLIAGFVAYKAVVIGTSIVTSILQAKIIALTAVQWLYNAALAANPIGLIVAGVVALIAGIVLLILKWDVIKNAFIEGGKAIFNIFSKIFTIIGKAASLAGSFLFSDFFGKDKDITQKSEITNKTEGFDPPNKAEADAQASRFSGVLKFENKPDSVKFTSTTIGAPFLTTEGLGAN